MSKQRNDYFKGKKDEEIFRELTGAEEGTAYQDRHEHTDCILNGVSIDVKGMKSKHKKGFVLVELRNVEGKKGWCSPKGADMIAFMFPEGFYVVKNRSLHNLAIHKWKVNGADKKVLRKNRVPAKGNLYKLIGREKWKGTERKDVFLYITKEDLMKIAQAYVPLEGYDMSDCEIIETKKNGK